MRVASGSVALVSATAAARRAARASGDFWGEDGVESAREGARRMEWKCARSRRNSLRRGNAQRTVLASPVGFAARRAGARFRQPLV